MATGMYYAWGPINVTKKDSNGKHTRETVAIGAKVTPSDLGIDENAFNELVASGAVRKSPYPDIDQRSPNMQSPIEYYRAKAREAELNLNESVLSVAVDATPGEEEEEEEL